jgi:hypothetical protein
MLMIPLLATQFKLFYLAQAAGSCTELTLNCNLNYLVNTMISYGVTADSRMLARIDSGSFFDLSNPLFFITFSCACAVVCMMLLNFLSYNVLKSRIVCRRRWDLNICCGKTDGGGVNADIVQHCELPRFVEIDNVCELPFADKSFGHVLCSHTIEHVDDPAGFYRELKRVGQDVTIVLPPLWDISAAFNFLEHRHLFLTFKKEHQTLPPYIRLPFARTVQRIFKQRIHA